MRGRLQAARRRWLRPPPSTRSRSISRTSTGASADARTPWPAIRRKRRVMHARAAAGLLPGISGRHRADRRPVVGRRAGLVVRDLTGRVTAWIEVGLPDASRLHRGSKLAWPRVGLYPPRRPAALSQLSGAKIRRASDIPIRAFDRAAVEGGGAHRAARIAGDFGVRRRRADRARRADVHARDDGHRI